MSLRAAASAPPRTRPGQIGPLPDLLDNHRWAPNRGPGNWRGQVRRKIRPLEVVAEWPTPSPGRPKPSCGETDAWEQWWFAMRDCALLLRSSARDERVSSGPP